MWNRQRGDGVLIDVNDTGRADAVRILAQAGPSRKAKIYVGLGLRLVYQPENRKALVAAGDDQDLTGQGFVSEGGPQPFAHLLDSLDAADGPWLDLE